MSQQLSLQDEHLLDELARSLSDSVVLGLCGAGLSVPLGYPTWVGLAEELLDCVEVARRTGLPADAKLTVRAGKADLRYVAQWASQQLSRDEYLQFLKERFSPLASADFSSEHDCLVRLPVRLWMTTNYDHCLTEALARHLNLNVTSSDQIPFDDLLAGRTTMPYVVHLHGTAEKPEAMVLTAQDYEDLYIRHNQVSRQLQSLGPISILFVGYGLGDEEIKSCFRTAQALLGVRAARHYALLPKPGGDSDFEIEMKSRELRAHGVRAIFYPVRDGNHSGRSEVLRLLLNRLGRAMPPSVASIGVSWRPGPVTVPALRRELREVAEQAGLTGPLILRACSYADRELTLSVNGIDDMQRLTAAVHASGFWMPVGRDKDAGEEPLTGVQLPPNPSRRSERDRPLIKRDGRPLQLVALPVQGSAITCADLQVEPASAELTSGAPADSIQAPADPRSDALRHLATAVHARALGLLDPKKTLVEPRDLLAPLIPPALPFGLSDCFHPVLDWRLDSPLVHVWLYTGRSATASPPILAVTAVGAGVRSVREALESAAYSASLFGGVADTAVITNGFIYLSAIQISLPQSAARPTSRIMRLLQSAFGRRPAAVTAPTTMAAPQDAQDALAEFAAVCERLARDTGFVKVHRESYDKFHTYYTDLRIRAASPGRDPLILSAPPEGRFLTFCPYPLYATNDPKVLLRLSGDVLKSPEFSALMGAYYHEIIIRMRADLERRVEFWTRELMSDREQVAWFTGLSEDERAKVPDVVTGRKILEELGIDVQVPERRVPATVYYLQHLPEVHIPTAERWLKEFEASHQALARLVDDDLSPLWRRCLARIFDCALRHASLCEDRRISELFDTWCRTVDAMLQLEWSRHAERCKIAPEDLFKRTTIFDIEYDSELDEVRVFPSAVIDTSRAIVIIDRHKGTFTVHDPLDTAATRMLAPMKARPDVDLGDVMEAVLKGDRRIRDALFASPDLAGHICDVIFRGGNATPGIARLRTHVAQLASAATAGARWLRLLGLKAYNTADEALAPDDPNGLSASKALALSAANCIRAGYDPLPTLSRIRAGTHTVFPRSIAEPFAVAVRADPVAVDRFLQQGLIEPDKLDLSPAEQIAWDIESCMEASRIAGHFRAAARLLDPRGETLGSALLKAEEAFEAAYCAIYSSRPPAVDRLRQTLGGEPQTVRTESEGQL